MTGALLVLAAAVLVWPAPGGAIRRLAVPRAPTRRGLRIGALPSPVVAGLLVLGIGAVVSTPLVAVLAGGCAALAARALALRRRAATRDERLLALADALGVLSAELRAGRSLVDAAGVAAAGCADVRSGNDLALVVRSRATRASGLSGLDVDVARVGAAVELSLRTGCSLSAVLTAVEDDLRARHRHRSELRSATAGPRASATVLAGLPVVGLAMGGGVGADPWRVLTTTAAGQVLLVLGVLLEVGGVVWTGRLTRRAVPELSEGGGRGR